MADDNGPFGRGFDGLGPRLALFRHIRPPLCLRESEGKDEDSNGKLCIFYSFPYCQSETS